jgi:serine O-acetyltransferase
VPPLLAADPLGRHLAHRRGGVPDNGRLTDARDLLRADLERYGERPWLREQSIWAVAVHRFGGWADRQTGARGWLAGRLYWLAYRIVETLTGISLPKAVPVGPGLRIHHFGGIVIHDRARIGANCTLRHGVTIGDREPGGPVPVIGDDVEIGAYAQILGGITVGRGARIGALSVVLDDVPPGATAVGNPARVLPR